jgi:predicted O-methyltransferase YrrM
MSERSDAAVFYSEIDADPAGHPLTAESVERYAKQYQASPRFEFIDRCKSISMLHHETVLLLNFFARTTRGPILEIGPYLGDSTVAMAAGLKEVGGGTLVTMEAGGAYDHPQLPSRDILQDLRRNLREFGVEDSVRIVAEWSDRRAGMKVVRELLAPDSVKLLVIDADGAVGRDLWIYEPLLADGCILVFDDYESAASAE